MSNVARERRRKVAPSLGRTASCQPDHPVVKTGAGGTSLHSSISDITSVPPGSRWRRKRRNASAAASGAVRSWNELEETRMVR